MWFWGRMKNSGMLSVWGCHLPVTKGRTLKIRLRMNIVVQMCSVLLLIACGRIVSFLCRASQTFLFCNPISKKVFLGDPFMDSLMLIIRVNVTLVYKNIYIWFVKPICLATPKLHSATPFGVATHSLRRPVIVSRSLFVLRIERVLYFLRQCVEPPVRFNFRWGRMKWIDAYCCALVICSTARSRAFTLHISLMFSAAADHTNDLHSRLDHCMHSERMHKL